MRTSRPPRARGLKLMTDQVYVKQGQSRPPRARGLKHTKKPDIDNLEKVAPPAGAWIETSDYAIGHHHSAGRAPRGRVD